MGSLIEYLKRETAVNVLEKTVKHAQIAQECVNKLETGIITLLKEKNIEKAHVLCHEVDIAEDKADKLKREVQKDISSGELNPSVRQNLLQLIKTLDQVANCSTGVARRINTIPMKFWDQCSEGTIELILQIMKETSRCAQYLDKIVIDLIGDRKEVKNYAEQINESEHEVDLLNIKLRESLQETAYDVNYFTAFTAGSVFDIMEAISDAIENVADYIMVLLTGADGI